MPDIIQLLPDSIANQIAAGEVVQRPASAVKELLENSIDAGASSIKLVVRDAGKALIQVIDDGMGMSETDARMSLERHATSKIRSAQDLFTLRTMGFRGEALASIAAVSQMEMKTRQDHRDLGTLLVVEGSEVKKQEPVACEKGTNISVKNLFYNIPARRNFLKSNPVELRHIIEEFQRLALAHSDVAFSLIQGDELLYELPQSKLSLRIVALFGKSYQEQLAPCQEETTLVQVSGYVGRPDAAKKTRGEQFIFVNRRFIRSSYLQHAVMSAFEGLLPDNSYPFYVLFIDIDPRHIDVNVHPTKTEIKFDDERAVYAVVRSAVRQALGSHNLTPAIDFQSDVNIINKLSRAEALANQEYYNEQFPVRSDSERWERLFEDDAPVAESSPVDQKMTLRFASAANDSEAISTGERIAFQLHDKYIVRSVKNGLMIIDQQGAHERVLFEKFVTQLQGIPGASQQSLFPQTVTLSPGDAELLQTIEAEVRQLGFRFEPFGKNTIVVSGIPASTSGSEKELMEGLIEQFKRNQNELGLPINESLARAMAKRCAIKSGQKLGKDEIESLVAGLFACRTPNFTPEGDTTFFIFDTSKIESYFRR